MRLNVDTTALVSLTNKLEKLAKSALPNAIRNSLNDAAFDMKTKTLLTSANQSFEKRQPNFFKANSKFEKAQGFNVNQMQSIVGMVKLKGNNYAVDDLEQQEYGGTIKKKSFIPLKQARVAGSTNKVVRSNARLSNIKRIIDAKRYGKNKKAFRIAALKAGKGGFVISENELWRIDSIGKNRKIKKTPLYSFKKGRSIHVRATGFSKRAGLNTAKQMEVFYIRQAKRQLEKFR